MAYLRDVAYQLVGRSGMSEAGMNPLNPTVLESWARQMRYDFDPLEIEALYELDAVIRHPGEAK